MDASKPAQPARWWAVHWRAASAVAVDVALALAVFVATADQGTGFESELTGELQWLVRTLVAAVVALPVLVRRRNPYPLLVAGTAAWLVMRAPWGLMVALYTLSAQARRPRWYGWWVAGFAVIVPARLLLGTDRDPELSGSIAAMVAVLVVGVPVLLGLWVGGPARAGREPARPGGAAAGAAAPRGRAGQGAGAGPHRPGDARRGRAPGEPDGAPRRRAGGGAGRP
jgi:hypothetical protein